MMLSNDRKRRREFFFASAMLVAGLTLTGFSLVATTRANVQLAQATPPLQGSPSETTSDKPSTRPA
jgi:hypothetical protein